MDESNVQVCFIWCLGIDFFNLNLLRVVEVDDFSAC